VLCIDIGRVTFSTCLNIDGIVLPTVKSARDLGVLVAHDLSPSLHITSIVARAQAYGGYILCISFTHH